MGSLTNVNGGNLNLLAKFSILLMGGKLIITLDTELAWGHIGTKTYKSYLELFKETRSVVDDLLDLFDEYKVPVTWALVGRLLENPSEPSKFFNNLDKYYNGGIDIYDDNTLNNSGNSYLLYNTIINKILASKCRHEIACHSYNHIDYSSVDNDNMQLIQEDLRACVEIFNQYDIDLDTFIFPQNRIAHTNQLSKFGISYFRENDKNWFDLFPPPIDKALRQMDYFMPISPKISSIKNYKNEVTGVPGGIFFRIPHKGFKKNTPFTILRKKAYNGIKKAVRKNKIFTLWFHPFNFAFKKDQHFRELENVLSFARQLRQKGKLEIITMNKVEN